MLVMSLLKMVDYLGVIARGFGGLRNFCQGQAPVLLRRCALNEFAFVILHLRNTKRPRGFEEMNIPQANRGKQS